MLYPLSAFRSFWIVFVAIIIVIQLRDDLGPERAGNCQVEAFKVIEFFSKVFNKNPEPDMMDADADEDDIDNGRPQDRPEAPGNGSARRRSGRESEFSMPPWRIFDFGFHGSHQVSKAIIVKRNAVYRKQWKREDEDSGGKSDGKLKNDNDDEMRKPQKANKDKGDEMERSKRQNRKKMDRKSEDRDDKPSGNWRKVPTRKRNDDGDGDGRRFKTKGNKSMKASRRGDDENEFEEEQEVEEDPNAEKVTTTKQKQVRKHKPWFWSRRFKLVDDEPIEEGSFQKRLNKRFGDIEAWKRMIYCKFNFNAPECAKNETSTNTIDFFGKFKKFTKRPKNKSSTPSNNATTPSSNGTTGFTEGSTTEFTRATTSSFDEGRFATNGTTMAIPTRGTNNTTTQPSTTTTGGSTTTTLSPSTTQLSNITTTQGSTTVTQSNPTEGTTTGQPTTTGAPTTTTTQATTTANTSQQPPATQPAPVRMVPSFPPQDIPRTNPPVNNQPFTLLP